MSSFSWSSLALGVEPFLLTFFLKPLLSLHLAQVSVESLYRKINQFFFGDSIKFACDQRSRAVQLAGGDAESLALFHSERVENGVLCNFESGRVRNLLSKRAEQNDSRN